MTDGLDDPEDGEEFTELYGGNFGRVDLVHKGANGMPFLIAKSAAHVTKGATQMASKAQMMPVYDETGKLVGLVDPSKLQKVVTTVGSKSDAAAKRTIDRFKQREESAPSPDSAPSATETTVAEGAEEVQKALRTAKFVQGDPTAAVLKSAALGLGPDAAFDAVLASVDRESASSIANTVGFTAAKIASDSLPMRRAVSIAKAMAVRVAHAHARETVHRKPTDALDELQRRFNDPSRRR